MVGMLYMEINGFYVLGKRPQAMLDKSNHSRRGMIDGYIYR